VQEAENAISQCVEQRNAKLEQFEYFFEYCLEYLRRILKAVIQV